MNAGAEPELPKLLTVGEAAQILGVHPKTVGRWADSDGYPRAIRTLGGHRRVYAEDVHDLAADLSAARTARGGEPVR